MFRKKTETIDLAEYPTGVCVKVDKSYWFVQGKYKRRIPTLRILASWSFPFVITASPDALSSLITAKPLGFRDGTIIRAMDGTVFLISSRQRRKVTDPDFLKAAGVFRNEVRIASDAELALHELGEDLK